MHKNRRAQNHLPVNVVVGTVAFNSTIGLIGLLLLSYYKIPVNDAVIAIVGGMAGSLGTLLTTTRGETMGTAAEPMVTEAKITNAPDEAVPITDTPTPEPAPPTQTDEGETITEEH